MILNDAKLALRITVDAYDDDIASLIAAAKADLQIAGVLLPEDDDGLDDLEKRAIITYCRCHFGSPADYDRMKAAYDEQKAQVATATGYTDWGDDDDA